MIPCTNCWFEVLIVALFLTILGLYIHHLRTKKTVSLWTRLWEKLFSSSLRSSIKPKTVIRTSLRTSCGCPEFPCLAPGEIGIKPSPRRSKEKTPGDTKSQLSCPCSGTSCQVGSPTKSACVCTDLSYDITPSEAMKPSTLETACLCPDPSCLIVCQTGDGNTMPSCACTEGWLEVKSPSFANAASIRSSTECEICTNASCLDSTKTESVATLVISDTSCICNATPCPKETPKESTCSPDPICICCPHQAPALIEPCSTKTAVSSCVCSNVPSSKDESDKPPEEVPAEENPPGEDIPPGETPDEEKSAEEEPVEEKPAEEAPAEEKPAEEAPAEEKPREEAPAEETSPEEAPPEEAPAPEPEAPAEEAEAEIPPEEAPPE